MPGLPPCRRRARLPAAVAQLALLATAVGLGLGLAACTAPDEAAADAVEVPGATASVDPADPADPSDPSDPAPTSGAPDPAAETRAIELLQADRAAAGLAALAVSEELTVVARRHSGRMAEADRLYHNPDLVTEVTGWAKVGENVGRGPDVDAIHAGFRGSPSHARNLDDPDWTQVGIGVVVHDGQRWLTQVFLTPG